MILEQDYRVLARFLIQIHGDGALDYARRYSKKSSDRKGEVGKIWLNVAGVIVHLMAQNEWRRKSDLAGALTGGRRGTAMGGFPDASAERPAS